jgi:hypothetical protein
MLKLALVVGSIVAVVALVVALSKAAKAKLAADMERIMAVVHKNGEAFRAEMKKRQEELIERNRRIFEEHFGKAAA